MHIIRIKNEAPTIDGIPLPIKYSINVKDEFNITDPVKVVFSLCSTAGGGADWDYIGIDNIADYLTWGRYNPNFYAMVEDPIVWWSPHRLRVDVVAPSKIEQHFKPGFNHFVYSVGVAGTFHPCLENEVLKKSIAEKEDFHQGSLNIYKIDPDETITQKYYDEYPFEFLNHQILGGRLLAKRREGSTLYGLVKMHRRGVVVSLDHLMDPVHLNEGLYVFKHPEPQGSDVD